jgi:hypothetical protein
MTETFLLNMYLRIFSDEDDIVRIVIIMKIWFLNKNKTPPTNLTPAESLSPETITIGMVKITGSSFRKKTFQ